MLNFIFGFISGIVFFLFCLMLIIRINLIEIEQTGDYTYITPETCKANEKITRGFDKLARKIVNWFFDQES